MSEITDDAARVVTNKNVRRLRIRHWHELEAISLQATDDIHLP